MHTWKYKFQISIFQPPALADFSSMKNQFFEWFVRSFLNIFNNFNEQILSTTLSKLKSNFHIICFCTNILRQSFIWYIIKMIWPNSYFFTDSKWNQKTKIQKNVLLHYLQSIRTWGDQRVGWNSHTGLKISWVRSSNPRNCLT